MKKRWRLGACLVLTFLPTACNGQLASNEKQYLEEGYQRLSASAYVRESPDGHSFAFISEGELGEAVILTHLRRRAERARGELRQARLRGADAAETRRLEARVEAWEQRFDQTAGAFGKRPAGP